MDHALVSDHLDLTFWVAAYGLEVQLHIHFFFLTFTKGTRKDFIKRIKNTCLRHRYSGSRTSL